MNWWLKSYDDGIKYSASFANINLNVGRWKDCEKKDMIVRSNHYGLFSSFVCDGLALSRSNPFFSEFLFSLIDSRTAFRTLLNSKNSST